jgi:hypothetical protein
LRIQPVSGIQLSHTDSQVEAGRLECVYPVKRLPLLDAIAQLLEQFDARSFVERGARSSSQSI